MKSIKVILLVLTCLLISSCDKKASINEDWTPAPIISLPSSITINSTEAQENIAVEEVTAVTTVYIEEAINTREEYLDRVIRHVEPMIGREFRTEEFLLWLEQEKFPQVFEYLNSSTSKKDIENMLFEHTGESFYVLNDRFSGVLDEPEIAKEAGIFYPSLETRNEIVLAFAGDVNLIDGDYVMPTYKSMPNGVSDIFQNGLLAEMRAADIFLINNEFAFTERGAPTPGKPFTFRSQPENVYILSDMGVDVAFLANNHVFDYGADGLQDTLETLRTEGIQTFGAGMDLEEASQILYFIVNGRKIAYVGAGCIERYAIETPGATMDSPGIFRADENNTEPLLSLIQEASRNSDFVVVKFHWGNESTSELESYQRELAYMSIDAGADAIIGSHPHVLQGAEYYQGKPIVYSIGNYWFSQKYNYTCLLELIWNSGEIAVKFIPCITANGTTTLAFGETATEILKYYEEISFDVNIDGQGFITNGT